MNLFQKITDKLFVKQWNVGLARVDMKELLSSNKYSPDFKWIPIDNVKRFYADPFIFKNGNDGEINVIYEDYSLDDQYGKISLTTVDKDFEPLHSKEILDTRSHLSYPNVFVENGTTYIIPEASKSGHVTSYEFDFDNKRLINPKNIIQNLPLLDSTILVHNNKYWLFATKRGEHSNSKLYIYYADKMEGPYIPHAANPVKNSLNGSRPAGNFIKMNGEIYRPSQNCAQYYGKSVTINRVTLLNEKEFAEEAVVDIEPPGKSSFNFGIHTINVVDNVIVIDALKRVFMPVEQVKIFLKKIFKGKKAIPVTSAGFITLYQQYEPVSELIETTFL
ncbi:MAG: hypothetical protein JST81_00580 [Bacteroidetes bacterium]|nr:hypothetical protein [Bacteroidota bacterium]